MNKHRKFKAGAGLLLLGAAVTAWAVTFNLSDGATSISCSATGAAIDASGNITATVQSGCLPTGGSSPPPAGSFTLTVTKSGTGTGTVTSDVGGISCGATCTSTSLASGTSVTLTAAPDTGSGATFGGWSGGGCPSTGTTCTLTLTAATTVTATFAAPAGTCGALPADTTVIDTGSIGTNWAQQIFSPLPAQITAFKVTVPTGFTRSGSFTATKTSGASRSKLLVVSNCPGVPEPVDGQPACIVYQLEGSTVQMTGNASASKYECKLTPGNTYYVNAVSKTSLSDTTYTCSNTTNCSFYGSRSAPN